MPTISEESIDDVLQSLLTDTSDPVLFVEPATASIDALVATATELSDPPDLRVLANQSTLKDAAADFLVASQAADLIASAVLTLRSAPRTTATGLVVTPDWIGTIITAGTHTAAVTTNDTTFLDAATDFYNSQWETADGFRLRTPPLSRIRTTLRDTIGPEVEADFNAVLESLDTARGNGNGLDEVTISLLVAAKNQELLYDISKWGEDVGIASKATFSRTKTTLEELGLIDTEKVPIDVGRPRLRLKFAHEQLIGTNASDLAGIAQGLIQE